jgi:hypothetical protein
VGAEGLKLFVEKAFHKGADEKLGTIGTKSTK